MLKKAMALAGAAVLVNTLGVVLPATARTGSVENVQIGWAGAGHTNVKVTWTETAPAPNTLILGSGSGPGSFVIGTTTAEQANEYLIPTTALSATTDPDHKSWIQVTDGSDTPGQPTRVACTRLS